MQTVWFSCRAPVQFNGFRFQTLVAGLSLVVMRESGSGLPLSNWAAPDYKTDFLPLFHFVLLFHHPRSLSLSLSFLSSRPLAAKIVRFRLKEEIEMLP
ncbi:hypothetical protein AAC387_Pa05g3481 [Persea americana]